MSLNTMIKRGSRVVLKFNVKSAVAGDEGRVSSKTPNGWLRIKIHRTGEMVTVRNGPLRLDRPFHTKWGNGLGCQPTAYSWWRPLMRPSGVAPLPDCCYSDIANKYRSEQLQQFHKQKERKQRWQGFYHGLQPVLYHADAHTPANTILMVEMRRILPDVSCDKPISSNDLVHKLKGPRPPPVITSSLYDPENEAILISAVAG